MPVAGTYNCTVQSPMGAQTGAFVIAVEGDTFTGSLSSPMGSMEVANGKVSGNTIQWTMGMTMPMPMTLEGTATIDGDALTGSIKAGAFGSMAITGTRAG
ncbi:MAG: hypothetical protein ABJA20_11430 [Novosphingobium sp.]